MSRKTNQDRKIACVSALVLVGLISSIIHGENAEIAPHDSEILLRRAFANRYEVDSREFVDIVVRDRSGHELRRKIAVATKIIDGRLHSLGRFLEPEYLRGTTILTIENRDRGDDHFVYLRALQRIRRISLAQRRDSFMGTDLAYDDFERRHIEDYRLREMSTGSLAGEPVWVIEGAPKFRSDYARLEFFVAVSDECILLTKYYKSQSEAPYKIVHAPRQYVKKIGDHVVPSHLRVENLLRGTETVVWISEISLNPNLEDSLFTSSAIEVGRPIPGLER